MATAMEAAGGGLALQAQGVPRRIRVTRVEERLRWCRIGVMETLCI